MRRRGSKRSKGLAAFVFVLALTLATPAHADQVEGIVVSMEANFAVIDLGSTRGITVGDLVEVWRPLKVKHPTTGRMIVDRLRIGTLRVTQTRSTVSVARIDGDVDRAPAQGDIVILQRATGGVHSPQTTTPSPEPDADADADAEELDALFRSLRGMSLAQRREAYEHYVLGHPKSRHVEALWAEAQALERLERVEAAADERAKKEKLPRVASFARPRTAPAGIALQLGAEIDNATGALLHFRRAGSPTFTTVPMRPAGAGYYAATIPADAMSDGAIEYFVEATATSGATTSVVGAPSTPVALEVEEPSPPDSRPSSANPERSVIGSLLTDYASFNMKKANDTVWQSEAQLGVRFDDTGLRAIRSGFGVYRGRGGTLEDLDELGRSPRRVGLTYGYIEGEVAFASTFALVGRAIVGLREAGINGGGQGFLRFGNDRRTNLLIGGEVLGGIGIRGITQLEWNSFSRVPIMIRSEVTNQPAGVSAPEQRPPPGAPPTVSTGGGEVGLRTIVQVGYRLLPRLVVAARGSFQARTINHAGPGGGAAVSYEW